MHRKLLACERLFLLCGVAARGKCLCTVDTFVLLPLQLPSYSWPPTFLLLQRGAFLRSPLHYLPLQQTERVYKEGKKCHKSK